MRVCACVRVCARARPRQALAIARVAPCCAATWCAESKASASAVQLPHATLEYPSFLGHQRVRTGTIGRARHCLLRDFLRVGQRVRDARLRTCKRARACARAVAWCARVFLCACMCAHVVFVSVRVCVRVLTAAVPAPIENTPSRLKYGFAPALRALAPTLREQKADERDERKARNPVRRRGPPSLVCATRWLSGPSTRAVPGGPVRRNGEGSTGGGACGHVRPGTRYGG
jgi:hypothetical protein